MEGKGREPRAEDRSGGDKSGQDLLPLDAELKSERQLYDQWMRTIWKRDLMEPDKAHQRMKEYQAIEHQAMTRQAREHQARLEQAKKDQPLGISEEEMTRRRQLKQEWDEEIRQREENAWARAQQQIKARRELKPKATEHQAGEDQVRLGQARQDQPVGVSEEEMTRRRQLKEAWDEQQQAGTTKGYYGSKPVRDEEDHVRKEQEKAKTLQLPEALEGREAQADKCQTRNASIPNPSQMGTFNSEIEATSRFPLANPAIYVQPEIALHEELLELGYSEEEIQQLLIDDAHQSKWIYFKPPQPSHAEITPDYHRDGCVHDVICNLWSDLATTSSFDYPARKTQEWVRRHISELCGLAGVLPSSLDHTEWNGQAAFDDTDDITINITYESPVQAVDQASPLERRLCDTMKRLKAAFRVLQNKDVSCDSFTVIRSYKRQSGKKSAELVRVKANSILNLSKALEDFRHHDHGTRLQLGKLARGIIKDVVNPTTPSWLRWFEKLGKDDEYLAKKAFHLASFSAQVLCLGVLSYVHGHIGTLHPFFLVKPVYRVNLKGSGALFSSSLHIVLQTTRLTCIEGLTGDAVMAFSASHGDSDRPAGEVSAEASLVMQEVLRCDLLASSEDLIDTWGPSLLVPSPQDKQLLAVVIGGGVITRHTDDTMGLHWTPTLRGPLINTFEAYSKAFIGAASLNLDCPLDDIATATLDHNSGQTLVLGTSSSYWQLAGGTLAVGGGQFVNATATAEFEKKPGVTLKQTLIKRVTTRSAMSLPDLEAYYGVQISLCTGLARRVRLRELLADVVPAYAEAQIPTPKAWKDLGEAFVHALSGPKFGPFLDAQPPKLQKSIIDLLRGLICNLEQTGFDPIEQKLVIAWIRPGQDNACLRLPCKADTAWARILQDTEHCATFACVTTKCLQNEDCKCQNRKQAFWKSESKMLITEVTQFDERPPAVFGEPFVLKEKARFWIGPSAAGLQAIVKLNVSTAEPHLLVTKSLLPESVRNLMFNKYYARRQIRERGSILGKAESVTVLAST